MADPILEKLDREIQLAKEEMQYECLMEFNEWMFGSPLGPWREIQLMGLQEMLDKYGDNDA